MLAIKFMLACRTRLIVEVSNGVDNSVEAIFTRAAMGCRALPCGIVDLYWKATAQRARVDDGVGKCGIAWLPGAYRCSLVWWQWYTGYTGQP
jgi:hypothetical protein